MISPEIIDEVVRLSEMTVGYVYLMRCGATNYYKIGRSTNVNSRRKAIQMCNPYPIIVIASHRTQLMQRLEQRMHKMFAEKRVHGEWFMLSEDDVAKFKEK